MCGATIQRIGITLLLTLLFFAPRPASAAERGTAEKAHALVEKAIARYKQVGGTLILPYKHGASLIAAALQRCADQSPPD
jgi:hypothetical protein